jgi:hypothetical protein
MYLNNVHIFSVHHPPLDIIQSQFCVPLIFMAPPPPSFSMIPSMSGFVFQVISHLRSVWFCLLYPSYLHGLRSHMDFVNLTIVDDLYKLQSSSSISHFILRPNILGSPLFSNAFTSVVFSKNKRSCLKIQGNYIPVHIMRFAVSRVIVAQIKIILTL